MSDFGRDNGVHYGYILAGSGCHACVDYEVGVKCVNECDGSDGGVDFAYAALHECHSVGAYVADVKLGAARLAGLAVIHERQEQVELLGHGYDYSYCHIVTCSSEQRL